MARIDLEKLAKEYGLHVEKKDLGWWTDARLKLYLDKEHTGGACLLSGVKPPTETYVHYDCIDYILVCADLRPNKKSGKMEFHQERRVYNDDYNEQYLRGLIEPTLEQYKAIKDEKTTGLRHS